MSGIVTAHPILYRVTVTRSDPDAVAGFIEATSEILERRHPFVTLVDARGLSVIPSPADRQRLSHWLSRSRELIAAWNVGTAIVHRSNIVTLLIRALEWFAPAPSPQLHTSHLAEAERCIQKWLGEHRGEVVEWKHRE